MRVLGLRTLVLAALLAATGCPASSNEVQPAPDQFYFPTGLAMTDGGRYLLVANANSDLRFDSGILGVVDLDRVETTARAWLASDEVDEGCEPGASDPSRLLCDESPFWVANSSRRIGNFAGEIELQTLASGAQRAFMPVRGDPSVLWVDVDVDTGTLTCDDSGGAFPRCDSSHRVTNLFNDPEQRQLTTEPFGIYVDGGNEIAAVTHLTSGDVSLVFAPADGQRPALVDIEAGATLSGQSNGSVDVAGRRPGSPGDFLYSGSRGANRVQMFTLSRPSADGPPVLGRAGFFNLDALTPASESRGMVFSDDGERLYVLNRNTPSLVVIDTADGPSGQPNNVVVGSVEMCGRATLIELGDVGRGEKAYVTCFRQGTVWVIDVARLSLDAIINVGRGPDDLVVDEARQLLYVTNFLDDSVAVIDLAPASPTENRAVLSLGLGPDEF